MKEYTYNVFVPSEFGGQFLINGEWKIGRMEGGVVYAREMGTGRERIFSRHPNATILNVEEREIPISSRGLK